MMTDVNGSDDISKPYTLDDVGFFTNLPDLVEERMILRQQTKRLKELDKEIRASVIVEKDRGTSVDSLAKLLGVSKARIYEICNMWRGV
jgi:hypothetical protein